MNSSKEGEGLNEGDGGEGRGVRDMVFFMFMFRSRGSRRLCVRILIGIVKSTYDTMKYFDVLLM